MLHAFHLKTTNSWVLNRSHFGFTAQERRLATPLLRVTDRRANLLRCQIAGPPATPASWPSRPTIREGEGGVRTGRGPGGGEETQMKLGY